MLLLLLAVPCLTVLAASTDFESFASGTFANAISVPGLSFSTTGGASPWQIYSPYNSPPYIVGKALGTFGGDTLTLNFNPAQTGIQFGYGSLSAMTARLYRSGVLIDTQTLGATGIGTYRFATLGTLDGFDSIQIFTASDAAIDHIVTSNAPPASAGIQPCASDGRLNSYACAAPVAIYCRDDGGIDLYAIKGNQGVIAVHVTREEIEAVGVPEENVALGSQGSTTLYRLTTGEFQVNATYPQDGKAYVFTWDACPATHSYTLAS